MFNKRKNWIRLIIGGAVASGLLTILLYGFVFTNNLSEELAIPWTSMRQNVLMVDWTCLFLTSFATAILIGLTITRINGIKGMLAGFIFGLLPLISGIILNGNVNGTIYYFACYLIWGLIFGIIYHKKNNLIIRQL